MPPSLPAIASSLAALALAACAPADVQQALERAGYEVSTGSLSWFYVEDCIGLDYCYANNPASPYGLVMLPPAADEPVLDLPAPFEDGELRSTWRLRGDEAVVLFGRTPPACAYYGLTPYLFARDDTPLFASLGDTTNQDVVGEDPFDTPFAWVLTSSTATAAAVQKALGAEGIDEAATFVQPLPAETVRFGHDEGADLLTMLLRMAIPADEAAAAAYREDTPITVLRVAAPEPRAADPLDTLALRPHGLDGVDESDLAPALERLDAAVQATYGTGAATAFFQVPVSGPDCIEDDRPCLGDNNDSPYLAALPRTLGATERLLVYGVRHETTAIATYAGLAVNEQAHARGVGGFTTAEAAGSADALLPGDPDAAHLFAYTLARDCGAEAFCFEVPTGGTGIALDEPLTLVWRAYLQPGTRTGPRVEDLLAPRVVALP